MKSQYSWVHLAATLSLPVRGAWVEMTFVPMVTSLLCRSPCGERGLKSVWWLHRCYHARGRSPCGERGLKLMD